MLPRTRVIRLAVGIAVIASLTTAAVAVAHGSRPGGPAVRHHPHSYGATGWVVPSASGTLVVRDFNGRSHSFVVNGSTKFRYANGKSATAADASPGTVVAVRATRPTTSGGNPVAKTVVIQLARLSGMVESDTADVLTIVDTQGFTRSINASSATCKSKRTTVNCGTIAPGSVVSAVGTVDPDHTTLDATSVRVTPPS